MGQDAVNVANEFNGRIGLTGIVLTRIDGGGRAGCALTMKIATGCPIKYTTYGEKLTQIEEFHPERIASKILDNIEGIGVFRFTERDVVRHHLVKKIISAYDAYEREAQSKKFSAEQRKIKGSAKNV
jgi:signal recognition particle GTPase